jgi:hypothetical protein
MTRHTVVCGMVLLVVLLGSLPLSTARATQPEPVASPTASVATPEAAAVFYSELEAAGQFSELYRWIHPDAQRIIPESAVVGWYETDFAPRGPGAITVTGVQMVSWTWEVTGTTYPNTAEVAFQQPFADGTILTDVVRLVESEGAWRWFFGRNRAFVDEQIARYPSTTGATSAECAGASEWWAATYPRTFFPAYLASTFPTLWNDGNVSGAVLSSYADTLGRLAEEQEAATPPPAATTLQEDLLLVFSAYEIALTDLAEAQAGQLDPTDEADARDAGLAGIDDTGADFEAFNSAVEAFTATCQPLVVFVFGQGEDAPVGVLPGEVGPDVPVVRCELFQTPEEAQRFFVAAGAGDPHGLDSDGNGIACEDVRPVGYHLASVSREVRGLGRYSGPHVSGITARPMA